MLASRSSTAEQTQVGPEMRAKALQEENEKLRESVHELERTVARLQRQVADLQGDEAKAKEMLKKYQVRLAGPRAQAWQCRILLSYVTKNTATGEAERDLLS